MIICKNFTDRKCWWPGRKWFFPAGISIPESKLMEMINLAKEIYLQKQTTCQQLKVLVGRLARVIMVIRAGRRFVNRILSLLQGPPQPGYMTLHQGALDDISWWVSHGNSLNCKSLIDLPVLQREARFVVDGRGKSSDGVPSVGGLCYMFKEYFAEDVPGDDVAEDPIHIIEALALLVASRLWVSRLPSQSVVPIGSDNMAVVSSIQSGKARDPKLAATVRLLWVWGLFGSHGSVCLVRYVPTDLNTSDGVSRKKLSHMNYLDSKGWTRLRPDKDLFSLQEEYEP